MSETDRMSVEKSIRPSRFSEIVGRKREKEILTTAIKAAQKRNESNLDHILFYGPPGVGKTTFALAIANELGANIRITSGPAIERQGDLAAILTSLEEGDVLFIDEIHRLGKNVEEVLYPAMEDFALDIMIGKGPSARSVRLSLKKFTLIGATTRLSLLSSPLRDRFGLQLHLDYLSSSDLAAIVEKASGILGLKISKEATVEIAKRSRGTARVALRLLRRVRDVVHMNDTRGGIGVKEVENMLKMMEIDDLGLNDVDRKLLLTIIENFHGGPVGLSSLAAALNEDKTTIEEVYEPFLIKLGLLKRTKRGRVVTQKGYTHMGMQNADGLFNMSSSGRDE